MALGYTDAGLKAVYDRLPAPFQDAAATLYGFRHRRRVYGAAYRRMRELYDGSQWWSEAELVDYRDARLREFVDHAYNFSPFWRDLFGERGVGPADIAGARDLGLLPILDKETLRTQTARIVSTYYAGRPGDFLHVHTSGTTGKALHIPLARECWVRDYALRDLHRSWAGVSPGDRTATFAGHPVVPTERMKPPFWRHNRAEHQLLFSSQHISEDTLPFYVDELRRYRPMLVHGYPSSVYLLALFLTGNGVTDIRPRAVFVHSESLLEFQRRVIEKAFGCKVFNAYGNTEAAGHIVECEEGSLHVKMEHSVVELLGPDGAAAKPGEVGELVCTAFGNPATPLFRYAVGDSAVPAEGECRCGRKGPLVQQLAGRIEDTVVTPDGRHVGRLDHVFKDALNVVEAQLIQNDVDRLIVRMVRRTQFGEADLGEIERELRLRLGSAIKLQYEFVDGIPREPNGKFRFTVSSVPIRIGAGAGDTGD